MGERGYSPPDLKERQHVQIPNFMWPTYPERGWLSDGFAHYYAERTAGTNVGWAICRNGYGFSEGMLADERDGEHICRKCLELLQTKDFEV